MERSISFSSFTPKRRIRFWENSIVRRYFLISLLVALVPLVIAIFLYDRLTSQLQDNIVSQRYRFQLEQVRTEMINRLQHHQRALKAIASLPDIEQLVSTGSELSLPAGTLNLIYFDIDQPEIYGALFFDRDWQLQRAIPGQSASGSPYWGQGEFSLQNLPRSRLGSDWLIGPQPPKRGLSGWYLIARPLPAADPFGPSPGYVAFQLRLASLTAALSELNSTEHTGCFAVAVHQCFNLLGKNIAPVQQPVAQLPLINNWRISMLPDSDVADVWIDDPRWLYLVLGAMALLLVLLFFIVLVHRARQRLEPLIQGADAIARGEWAHRIEPFGHDEVTQLTVSFNKMADQLDDLMASKVKMERKAVQGDFATGVAHEIRNPLATIKVCIQSLAIPSGQTDAAELKQLMLEEIDRINQLIQNLLNYSRPPKPEIREIDARQLLERVVKLLRPLAAEKNVALEYHAGEPVRLSIDPEQIQQILMNLVLNAIEAIESKATDGSILLQCEQQQQLVKISVKDNGPGIPEDSLKQVLDPFYTTKTTGTGLGLAISAQLASLNGGRLDLESEPGLGTTASLTFG
ncbi:sensor histidine kinase [Endozoicomonadaceae bacterium StTr2]